MARFSEAERALVWDWWQQGGSMRGVARELGRSSSSVRTMIESHGGCVRCLVVGTSGICRWRSGRRSPVGWLPVSRCGRSR